MVGATSICLSAVIIFSAMVDSKRLNLLKRIAKRNETRGPTVVEESRVPDDSSEKRTQEPIAPAWAYVVENAMTQGGMLFPIRKENYKLWVPRVDMKAWKESEVLPEPVKTGAMTEVLELASGQGSWGMDLARKHPNANVVSGDFANGPDPVIVKLKHGSIHTKIFLNNKELPAKVKADAAYVGPGSKDLIFMNNGHGFCRDLCAGHGHTCGGVKMSVEYLRAFFDAIATMLKDDGVSVFTATEPVFPIVIQTALSTEDYPAEVDVEAVHIPHEGPPRRSTRNSEGNAATLIIKRDVFIPNMF